MNIFYSTMSLARGPLSPMIRSMHRRLTTPSQSSFSSVSYPSYTSRISRRRLIVDLVAAAAGVDTMYAPPAIVCRENVLVNLPISSRPNCPCSTFLHALHDQIPVECRFTVVLPQKVQV